MNYFDHIHDYKAGALQGEVLSNFERALESDEALRYAVEQYDSGRALSEGLLEVDMMTTIQNLEIEQAAEPKVVSLPSKATQKFNWQKYVAAASLIGILAFAGYFILRKPDVLTKEQVMAQIYRPPIYDMERGADVDEMTNLEKGKYAFHLKDYEQSEEFLLFILEQSADQEERKLAQYYLGHVYLMQEKYSNAQTYFAESKFEDFEYQLKTLECLEDPENCSLHN